MRPYGKYGFCLAMIAAGMLLPGTLFPAAARADVQEADLDEAREQLVAQRFLAVLEKNPRRGTALDKVYGFHVERGSLDKLIQTYRDKAAAGSGAGTAWMIVGLLESLRAHDAASVDAFGRAEQLDSANWSAPYYLGQSLVLIGQPDKGADAFERALLRKPAPADRLDVFQALGRVYQRVQQTDRALEVWNRLERQFPNDVRVQEQIATTLLEEGEIAAALPRFQALVTLTKDKYRQSLFQIEVADVKRRLGRKDEAIAELERLLGQLNPESWLYRDVRRRIEEIFLRTDDQTGLIAYYEGWIGKHPDDLEAVSRFARTLLGMGRGQESRQWLEKALKAAPSKKDLRLGLIHQLVNEQKYVAAIEHYQQLDKYEPNNPDTLREWGRLILKDSSREPAARQQGAATIWRQMLVAKPKDPLTASLVADLFRQAAMVDDALELYRRAIDLDPESAQYKEYLGEYYHSLQRKDDALSVWRSIAAGKLKTAPNVARLAEVLGGFGYLDEAIQTNAEACQLDPKDISLRIKQADLLSQAERHDDALQELVTVQKLAANDEELEAWLSRELQELQSLGKIPDRIAAVRKELEANTNATGGTEEKSKQAAKWYWLARAHELTREFKEAGAAATKAADLVPQSVPILAAAARILEQQYNLLGAAEINVRLAAVDRRFRTEYLKKVAQLEVLLGRHDKALQAGRDMVAAAPGNPETYDAFAKLCFQLGRNDEGLEALRRSIRVNPADRKGLVTLAVALSEQYRSAEAIELYWRAFEVVGNLEDRLKIIPPLTELYLHTHQVDRLLERLERMRREPNQQRDMTLCLAQAHQSAGDDGTARQELEKLLTENSRDTLPLEQLVRLCEANEDLESAIRYQQQINTIAPDKNGTWRLSQLLLKADDVDTASELILQVVINEQNPEQVIRAVDSLLSRGQDVAAERILQKLVRDQPRNWELLYRYAVAIVVRDPDEAARRFGSILALRLKDDERSLLTGPSMASFQALLGFNNLVTSFSDGSIHTLAGRAELSSIIRDSIEEHDARRRQHEPIWMPADYGQARLAVYAWQIAVATKLRRLDSFVQAKRESLSQSTEWRDLIDWYYITLVLDLTKEQYEVTKALSQRTDADRDVMQAYFNSLRFRDPVEVDPESTADAEEKADDPLDREFPDFHRINVAPLSVEEMDYVVRITTELKLQTSFDPMQGVSTLDLVATELKRSGRVEQARKMFAVAAASAREPLEIAAVINYFVRREDFETALQLLDRLARIPAPLGTPSSNVSGSMQYAQFVSTPEYQGNILCRILWDRSLANDRAKGANPTDGLLDLWNRYLESVEARPVVMNTTRISKTRDPYHDSQTYHVRHRRWGNYSVHFPSPNAVYDQASIQMLLQIFALHHQSERQASLIEAFSAKANDPQASPDRQRRWRLGLGYLQWWNDDVDKAFHTLRQADLTEDETVELKVALARWKEEHQNFAEALAIIDSLTPTDQGALRQREIMALRLAVNCSNVERARIAADRLFGLRLDSDLQLALARQMHQLGMHTQAESVLARASRQGGSKNEVLLNLMQQYASSGKVEIAEQIAHQLLRRFKPTSEWDSIDDASEFTPVLQVLKRSGKLSEMIVRAESQLKATPQSRRLLSLLIEFHAASGNEPRFEELKSRLVETRLDDPKVRYELAIKLLQSDNIPAATEHLKVVFEQHPSVSIEILDYLFQQYQSARHPEELAKLCESLDLQAFRNKPSALIGLINNLAGEESTWKQSIALMDRAWQALPDARTQLLAHVNSDGIWTRPQAFEYVIQGFVPSQKSVHDRRWHGFDECTVDDSPVFTLATRVMKISAELDKLAALEAEVQLAANKFPDWSGGPVILGLIDLRMGRVEQARNRFEAMLPAFSKVSKDDVETIRPILSEIAQGLASNESCDDLAIRYFKLAVAADERIRHNFILRKYKSLVKLLNRQGRTAEAREMLLRGMSAVKSNRSRGFGCCFVAGPDPVLEDFEFFGQALRDLGSPGLALKVYEQGLNELSGRRNPGHAEHDVQRLEIGVNELLAELKAESIMELLEPIPEPDMNQPPDAVNVRWWPRSAGKQGKEKESPDEIKLHLEYEALPGGGQRMSSRLFKQLDRLIVKPGMIDQATLALSKMRLRQPDDFGLAMLAAHVTLASGNATMRKAGVDELVALVGRRSFASLPDDGHEGNTKSQAAWAQVPLWLIARECWPDPALRESAKPLVARTLEAAKILGNHQYVAQMVDEYVDLILDSGDRSQAELLWTQNLEQVLRKQDHPGKSRSSTVAGSLNGAQGETSERVGEKLRPVWLHDFQEASRIARRTAEQGLLSLSRRCIEQTLRQGPPLEQYSRQGSDQLFGQHQPLNLYSSGTSFVYDRIDSLVTLWRQKGMTHQECFEILKGTVFIESRPLEISLYPVAPADDDGLEFQSVGLLLIKSAILADKVDELKSVAQSRVRQPLGQLAGHVLLAQLDLATDDITAAREHLEWIADRVRQDSDQMTSDLACHAAVPAMEHADLHTIAVALVADAIDHQHKALIAGAQIVDRRAIDALTFRLLGHYLRNQRVDQAMQLAESWTALPGSPWDKHHAAMQDRRKDGALRIAAAFAQAGLTRETLDVLGRYADLPLLSIDRPDILACRRREHAAVVLSHLASIDAARCYELLSAWALPVADRRSVRLFATMIPADRAPRAFNAIRGAVAPRPQVPRFCSTLRILIDAARRVEKLEELQHKLQEHMTAGVENAAHALAMVRLANGHGADALDAIQKRNGTYLHENDDPSLKGHDRLEVQLYDIELARAALLDHDPVMRQQGQTLAWNVIRAASDNSNTELSSIMRHELFSALIGSVHAGELDSRGLETEWKHWVAGSTSLAFDDHQTMSLPNWWIGQENQISHACGMGGDYLYFAYPLVGRFDLECEIMNSDSAGANLAYGGLTILGFDRSSEIGIFQAGRRGNVIEKKGPPHRSHVFQRLLLSVRDDQISTRINGYPVDIAKNVTQTSPFIALYAERQNHAVFRNIKLTGSPVVPREVALVSDRDDSLLGWSCDFYGESRSHFSINNQDQDAAASSPQRKSKTDHGGFNWSVTDGEIHGSQMTEVLPTSTRPVQSWLFYNRPLRERESVQYEFWYEPGDGRSLTHPAIDRLAFLLEPDGVRVHWMTSSNEVSEHNLLAADNALVEPDARRGPRILPLKQGDWNKVEVGLSEATLTLKLNGTLIYERPLEQDNSRQFGLFHDRRRQSVRVRNVVLTGDWPQNVGPEILNNLYERARPVTAETRQALAAITDDHKDVGGIDKVLLNTGISPLEQRGIGAKEAVASPRRQWTQVTLVNAEEHLRGLRPTWRFDGPEATHIRGFGRNLLYFQSPLSGRFAVECQVPAGDNRSTGLMFNAHWGTPRFWRGRTVSGDLNTNEEISPIAPARQEPIVRTVAFRPVPGGGLEQPQDWSIVRLEVEPGTSTWFANGRKVHEETSTQSVDPWLAIHVAGQSEGGVRYVRIMGQPTIPVQIDVTSQPGMAGWWSGMYQETVAGEAPDWTRFGEEIFAYRHDDERSLFRESLLQHHRPMLEDGEITYEFFHVPNQTGVHPALGRLAFLLDEEGVKLHQLTDAEFEHSGVEPDNATIELDCQRVTRLPLKVSHWNRIRLAVNGDRMALSLNDTLIYDRLIESTNLRHFGLFHYRGDTNARVRNVVYRGQWPKMLPPLQDQELAGQDANLATVPTSTNKQKGVP